MTYGETSFSKDSNDNSFATFLDGEDESCLDMIQDYIDQLLEQFDSQEDTIREAVAEDISTREFWEKYLTEDQAAEANSNISDSQTDMPSAETVQAKQAL